MSLRIAFMGTPDFAVPALEALIEAGHEVAAVYSQPPRPTGRGHRTRPSPVHACAEARGIPVRTPTSLKGAEAQAEFAALGLDLAVVVAYGLILPKPVLEAPRHGCINIHASLLPRWRGAAPIQAALLAGDPWTGITIMQMDEGLDTGPMLLTTRFPIEAGDTASLLHDRLSALGARMIVQALKTLEAGLLKPTPQPAEGATYAPKLKRDDGCLDWGRPAAELETAIRALNPWPGTWFEHRGERVKVLAARVEAGLGTPGTTLDDKLAVACGAGVLRLLTLQRPGKGPLPAAEFLRGFAIPAGTELACPPGSTAAAQGGHKQDERTVAAGQRHPTG